MLRDSFLILIFATQTNERIQTDAVNLRTQ